MVNICASASSSPFHYWRKVFAGFLGRFLLLDNQPLRHIFLVIYVIDIIACLIFFCIIVVRQVDSIDFIMLEIS